MYAGRRQLNEVPSGNGMLFCMPHNTPFWGQVGSDLGINNLSPIQPEDVPEYTKESKNRPYCILDNASTVTANSGLGTSGAPFRNEVITSYATATGNAVMKDLKARFKTRANELQRSSEWLTARVNQLQTSYVDSLIDIPKEYRVRRPVSYTHLTLPTKRIV